VRYVTRVGVASEVALGAAKAREVVFAPFIDKRFPGRTVGGVLGLDFFRGYAVYASWHDKTYYLKPRGDAAATATARLGRWGAALPACAHPGCVVAQIVAAAGGPTLEVARDPEAQGRALEVLIATAPMAGRSLASLLVELPRGVDKVTNALPADYAGAQALVADISPFPRACVGEGGCVLPVGGIADSAEVEPSPPPRAAPPADGPPAGRVAETATSAPSLPRNVALDKLHRLSGDAAIAPSDEVKKATGDRPLAAAIVRVCLAPDGAVESTKIVKSSGVTAYDDQLQSAIQATWKFSPVETSGAPERVCTSAVFATNH
jgi:TonB family protein